MFVYVYAYVYPLALAFAFTLAFLGLGLYFLINTSYLSFRTFVFFSTPTSILCKIFLYISFLNTPSNFFPLIFYHSNGHILRSISSCRGRNFFLNFKSLKNKRINESTLFISSNYCLFFK